MGKIDFNYFKKLLNKESERISDNSKSLRNELVDRTSQGGDEGDEASALSDAHLSLRFCDRDRQLLRKIKEALIRIEEGTFGECEDCGDQIGIKRLKIRPVASLCIKCKEDEERREGVFSNS